MQMYLSSTNARCEIVARTALLYGECVKALVEAGADPHLRLYNETESGLVYQGEHSTSSELQAQTATVRKKRESEFKALQAELLVEASRAGRSVSSCQADR